MTSESLRADQDFRGAPIYTVNPPSPEADRIRAALARNRVTAVYHWSPVRGISSILGDGILARRELARRGIRVVPHGYGSEEKAKALSNFVGVTFRAKPAMMRDWSESPVLFELDIEALLGDGTLFVPGNSASKAFDSLGLLRMHGADAFEALFAEGELVDGQAEAWIRSRIPRAAITAIHVAAGELAGPIASAVETVAPPMAKPPRIRVSPDLFGIEERDRLEREGTS